MATRSALIIGNARYADGKLSALSCPLIDVAAVQAVLQDPQFGAFDHVATLTDGPRAAVERAILSLFTGKSHDDLVLLYFSGHGLRDDEGELYLAASDTEFEHLEFTSVSAAFVKKVMDRSYSRRQVLILDCCHGGAFSSGFKGTEIGATAGTKGAFGGDGYGRMILAASDATQYAWEGDTLSGQPTQSRYTQFLLEGIRTGEADVNFDGLVTLSELHEYVSQRTIQEAIKQRPTLLGDRMQGQIILSKAPERIATLPEELTKALTSSFVALRKGAISELFDLYGNGSRGLALSALQAMVSLRADDSNAVRLAAMDAVEGCRSRRPDVGIELFSSIAVESAQPAKPQPPPVKAETSPDNAAAEQVDKDLGKSLADYVAMVPKPIATAALTAVATRAAAAAVQGAANLRKRTKAAAAAQKAEEERTLAESNAAAQQAEERKQAEAEPAAVPTEEDRKQAKVQAFGQKAEETREKAEALGRLRAKLLGPAEKETAEAREKAARRHPTDERHSAGAESAPSRAEQERKLVEPVETKPKIKKVVETAGGASTPEAAGIDNPEMRKLPKPDILAQYLKTRPEKPTTQPASRWANIVQVCMLVVGLGSIVYDYSWPKNFWPKRAPQTSSPTGPAKSTATQQNSINPSTNQANPAQAVPPPSKLPLNLNTVQPNSKPSRNSPNAPPNDNLIGQSVVLTEWRKAENRNTCAPIALVSDGGKGGKPRRANFSGGWAVAFDLPNLRSAYGVAGTGVEGSPSIQDLRNQWPYFLPYDGAVGYLPPHSAAGYGLAGASAYQPDNESGVGKESVAYLRVDRQGCLYNIWSNLGRGHLELLLNNLKVIPTSPALVSRR